jgi:sec-independent protein translocase protein TatC
VTFSESIKPFIVHFNELRSRVLKSLGVFIGAAFICFQFAESVLDWYIRPAGKLVFTSPGGGFAAVMTVTIVLTCLVTAPFIIYQIWAFASSALRPQEKKFVFIFGPLSLLFFVAGVLFAYFVAIPISYQFLMGFTSEFLVPMITVDHYLSFSGNMLIAFGVAFELPLILAFLAKIGIATPEYLRQKRRHAIVIILIVAAVATPPDVVSQLLLGIPLIVLYELGILFTRIFGKKF